MLIPIYKCLEEIVRMWKKKTLCALVLLSFLSALIIPAFETTKTTLIRADTYLARKKPPRPSGKPTKTSVDIRNIPSGDTIYSSVLIIAEVTGLAESDEVYYQIDSGLEIIMNRVGSTDRFQAMWDTNTVSLGSHTLYVKAKSSTDSVLASDSVEVTVVDSYQWEIYIEIDWIISPSTEVLEYMVEYWAGHAIEVSYEIDDPVSDPNGDGIISTYEFWVIENENNDGADWSEGGASPKYTLKEKWMLYGTWDEDSNVGGYTYVDVDGKDLLAGNYMFIAAAMINDWEIRNDIPNEGGEVIVVCHECGHSIGIAVLRGLFEKYDRDAYSVMSYMRIENAKLMAGYWYYSKEYWKTANLDYYK